eukprot:Unigene8399_Nuclearia_a/m.25707 Unigene8399_Nuclearia_a/g.25707  ORF Unigene8399_Nuclearia_a/g.25707 Unigene8399_Nuclearia_a/m.25707 type:complete len:130 (-) Unigene8399_Nuclearia_a:51-440(-)
MSTAAAKEAIAAAARQHTAAGSAPHHPPAQGHAHGGARASSPDFADAGVYRWDEWNTRKDLSHWDKQRLEWLRKRVSRPPAPPADHDAIYVALTEFNGELRRPVPLTDFLKVLVDVWYDDGIFNPPGPM